MRKIYKSISMVMSKSTLLVQLVSFRNKEDFREYLNVLNDCNLKEIKIKRSGHVWRKVPSRSWQARFVKKKAFTSKEVLLVHKIRCKLK